MACASLLTDENILRFRTKVCLRMLQGSCSFGDDRCQYSHSQVWTRRPPYYASPSFRHERLEAAHREPLLRYLPVPCEHLLIENGKVVKVTCQRGVNCPFAHSPEEIAYHPLVYKTQPCKAFSQRACRVYYCWKSHGEKERREVNKNVSLGIVKGLDVPVNYPGATLVELLPNKSGRRRRQRSVPSTAAGLLSSSSSGSKSSPLRCAAAHQGSQLLSHLVRQFADCPENVEAPPCPIEEGLGGDLQKGCEDTTTANNEPPLASLLRLFDNQLDLQLHPLETRGFAPQGRERSPPKKNGAKQASRRERLYLPGGYAMQQQQSLPEPLGEELPLRSPAELLASEQQQQKLAYPFLNEHLEFEGMARSPGRRGNVSSEPINPPSYSRSPFSFPSISPLRSGNSRLNLFAGLDDFLAKRNPQPDAFEQYSYSVQHLHQATSGNNPHWNDDREPPVPNDLDEGFDPLRSPWGTNNSAQSSFADTVRCSSWSTRPSLQSSSANTKLSFSELEQWPFDESKGGAAVGEGTDRQGSGRFTERRGGSFSPGCFPLEGSPSAGAGRVCRCMQRDLRFSGSARGSCEELPLLAIDREGGRCSEEWGERGVFWHAASGGGPSQLKGTPKQSNLDIIEPSNCDLHGNVGLEAVEEAQQEADDSNTLLMSCFMPLLKKAEKKEALEVEGLHGEVEAERPLKAGSPPLASCEPPLQADDAANYYSQLLTLWNTARHAHSFSAGGTESAQEQHSEKRNCAAKVAAGVSLCTAAANFGSQQERPE
ncbi:hypothetical protein Emed_001882 [Eimeria media]